MGATKDGATDNQLPLEINSDTEIGETIVVSNNAGYHRNFTPRQIHVRESTQPHVPLY